MDSGYEETPFHHYEEEGRIIRSVDDLRREGMYIEKSDPRGAGVSDNDSTASWMCPQIEEVRRLVFAQLSKDRKRAIFHPEKGSPEDISLEELGVIPNGEGLWHRHKYLVRA
jgi:hypothetical protein